MSNFDITVERLESFREVLATHGVVCGTDEISKLIASLKRTRVDKGLRYQLRDLKFRDVSESLFLSANKWDKKDFEVYLNVDVSLIPGGEFKFGDVKSSSVEIVYQACSEDTADFARGAWHLDFHNHDLDTTEPEFFHPCYHFQHGGRSVSDFANHYGDVLLLETPRVMHPPLDFFLGVDFLVTNFLKPRTRDNLRADTGYRQIIESSQDQWWKSYYENLSNYWPNKNLNGNKSKAICAEARRANPNLL